MIIFLIDSNDSNPNALILFAKKYFSTISDNNELDIDINDSNHQYNTCAIFVNPYHINIRCNVSYMLVDIVYIYVSYCQTHDQIALLYINTN